MPENNIILPQPIFALGNSVLREMTSPVETIEQARDISAKLRATLASIPTGVGLAAPQIGIGLSAFLMQKSGVGNVMVINPRIIKQRGVQGIEEGCSSISGVYGEVATRGDIIDVIYYNEELKQIRTKLRKFESIIFQHEFDHLNGVLFIDRMTKEGREEIADKLADVENGKITIHFPMIFKDSPSVILPETNP